MSTVQILIENESERDAIAQLVGKRYDVCTARTVESADLYLLDDRSLPQYRDQLRERKRESGQVFCPVVLIRREGTTVTEQALPSMDSAGESIIDEVLTAPLETETVVWRFDNLLTRRDTTRNLIAKNEELERRERKLQRYRAYIEQSSDIITALDATGEIQYQSPAIEHVLGYGQDELIGKNAFDLIHPDDRERITEQFEALVADPDGAVAVETRFETADGGWCWLEIQATNQLDTADIGAILTNSRDITGRKREERKRQRTIDRTTDAVFRLDEDWRFIELNNRAESILDIDADVVLGERIWDVFPAAVDTRFYDVYHEVKANREPAEIEEYFEEMSNWFHISVYPEPEDGLAVYLRDITDRKEREEQIERLNREFETVFENVRDGLFLLAIDAEERIRLQRFNDLAGDVLGAETEPEQNAALDTVANEQLLEHCRACLDSRIETELEQRIQSPAGERVFDIRLSPVVVDGSVPMIVGSARDVTERHAYEQRLESQRDDLQLLNQMVRHDIRNDLQVIQTHGELLAAELSDRYRSSAENIVSSARHAISLTEEARDLATIMLQSGETREPIDLSDTLLAQIGQIRSAYPNATVDIDGTIPRVFVEANEMLDSVFDNLLQNSIVHNDKSEPTTTISVSTTDNWVTIRIVDDGPGIPEERRTEIFEKGERGADSEGTGIGLYLVGTLVDQYEGEVSIEDRAAVIDDGQSGTAFTVRLPLAE